jgi:hypothetical protein
MDGIGSSWLTIILVFVIIGGMACFILLSTANDVDKTIETSVQQDLSTFVKECSNIGYVPADKLLALEDKVNSYGIRFELKLWVEKQIDGPTKKTTQLNNGMTAATQFITEEYTVQDIAKKGRLPLKENDILGISGENIGGTHEDNYSNQTNKDFATMKPQAVETVHVTGTN